MNCDFEFFELNSHLIGLKLFRFLVIFPDDSSSLCPLYGTVLNLRSQKIISSKKEFQRVDFWCKNKSVLFERSWKVICSMGSRKDLRIGLEKCMVSNLRCEGARILIFSAVVIWAPYYGSVRVGGSNLDGRGYRSPLRQKFCIDSYGFFQRLKAKFKTTEWISFLKV